MRDDVARAGKQRLVVLRPAAQVCELLLVAFGHLLDHVAIDARQQAGDGRHQRQPDDADDAGARRVLQPVHGKRGVHRLDDGVLAVDEGTVAIEQDQGHTSLIAWQKNGGERGTAGFIEDRFLLG